MNRALHEPEGIFVGKAHWMRLQRRVSSLEDAPQGWLAAASLLAGCAVSAAMSGLTFGPANDAEIAKAVILWAVAVASALLSAACMLFHRSLHRERRRQRSDIADEMEVIEVEGDGRQIEQGVVGRDEDTPERVFTE